MDLNLEPRPENPARKRTIALIVTILAIVALGVCMFTKRWQRVGQDDHRVGMGLISVEECHEGKCVTQSNKEFVEGRINGTIANINAAIGDIGKLRGYVSRDVATDDTFGDGYDMYGRPMTFEERLCSGDLDAAYSRMLDDEAILDGKRPPERSTTFMCRLVERGAADPRKLPETKSMASWLTGWITMVLIGLAVLSMITAVVLVAQGKFFLGPLAPTSWAILFLFLALILGCIFVASNPTRGERLDVLLGYQLGVGWSFWVFGVGVVLGIAGTQMLVKFKPAPIDHFH